ncbi:uncharacterized protein CBL_04699 [Carabus blaptoides fortunei]
MERGSVDKAVSTEDLCVVSRDINLEVARLEAMLNTLVENKVEAMKADKPKQISNHSTPKATKKRFQRITSSSTASSSHKDNAHGQNHQHRSHYRSHHGKRSRHGKRNGHSRYRIASNSPESPRYHRTHNQQQVQQLRPCCEHGVFSDNEVNEAFDFLSYQEHVCTATCDLDSAACSCPDNHNGQLHLAYEDDYVSINIEDFENVEEDAIIRYDALRRARRKRRKRRKKRRKKLQQRQISLTTTKDVKVKVIDPNDLPQRARWTIVATACLLLLMCLILVGVTLRMAPIIDDMGEQMNYYLITFILFFISH